METLIPRGVSNSNTSLVIEPTAVMPPREREHSKTEWTVQPPS